MREIANCLNALFVLLTLPLYLLVLVAALAGTLLGIPTPGWLPEALQFITTKIFLTVAMGLLVWFLIVNMIVDALMHNTVDYCGIEAAFHMFEDGLSGYLLLVGMIVAAIVLKITL